MRIFFLAAAALVASLSPSAPLKQVQHSAVHQIQMTERNGDWDRCTATAVGAHTLLTAAHCNVAKATLSVEDTPVKIISTLSDGHDHVLFLLKGITFQTFINLKIARATQQERVHFWGYPNFADEGSDQYRECYMTGRAPLGSDDNRVSDLYACPVAPGDSGSSLFNDKGEVVGIVSAREGGIMASYPIVFTDSQLALATTF